MVCLGEDHNGLPRRRRQRSAVKTVMSVSASAPCSSKQMTRYWSYAAPLKLRPYGAIKILLLLLLLLGPLDVVGNCLQCLYCNKGLTVMYASRNVLLANYLSANVSVTQTTGWHLVPQKSRCYTWYVHSSRRKHSEFVHVLQHTRCDCSTPAYPTNILWGWRRRHRTRCSRMHSSDCACLAPQHHTAVYHGTDRRLSYSCADCNNHIHVRTSSQHLTQSNIHTATCRQDLKSHQHFSIFKFRTVPVV